MILSEQPLRIISTSKPRASGDDPDQVNSEIMASK